MKYYWLQIETKKWRVVMKTPTVIVRPFESKWQYPGIMWYDNWATAGTSYYFSPQALDLNCKHFWVYLSPIFDNLLIHFPSFLKLLNLLVWVYSSKYAICDVSTCSLAGIRSTAWASSTGRRCGRCFGQPLACRCDTIDIIWRSHETLFHQQQVMIRFFLKTKHSIGKNSANQNEHWDFLSAGSGDALREFSIGNITNDNFIFKKLWKFCLRWTRFYNCWRHFKETLKSLPTLNKY